MRIILGSQSPHRRELMETLLAQQDTLETMDHGIDESAITGVSASHLTSALALAKNRGILARIEGPAIIVTADTLVTFPEGGAPQMRGKPESPAQARAWLEQYRWWYAGVITSVVVAYLPAVGGSRVLSATDDAQIHFQGLTDEAITAIIADGTALKCAGSIMVEHPLFAGRIERIKGDIDTVQGLPRRLVKQLMLDAQSEEV